jgi:hypothetical protein
MQINSAKDLSVDQIAFMRCHAHHVIQLNEDDHVASIAGSCLLPTDFWPMGA